jgi:hypothetical protein
MQLQITLGPPPSSPCWIRAAPTTSYRKPRLHARAYPSNTGHASRPWSRMGSASRVWASSATHHWTSAATASLLTYTSYLWRATTWSWAPDGWQHWDRSCGISATTRSPSPSRAGRFAGRGSRLADRLLSAQPPPPVRSSTSSWRTSTTFSASLAAYLPHAVGTTASPWCRGHRQWQYARIATPPCTKDELERQ